ncbi:MAG: transposase [Methylovulum miyakonense]|uniref:transposase n=1 Tax=Methylovulum miyakonense TaxID=645578 RepID=UPI003BB80F66
MDENARLLTQRGETTGGYNVQIAVDNKHKLIVAKEVTQEGNDTGLLAPMLEKAQAILQSENLTGLADSGYFEGGQHKPARKTTSPCRLPSLTNPSALRNRDVLPGDSLTMMPGGIATFARKAKRLSLPANRSTKTIKTISVTKAKPQSVLAAQSGNTVKANHTTQTNRTLGA